MPHLAPVPLSEVQDEDIRQRFEHYRNTRGFTPNSIMTMVRRPQIVRAFMALNQAVLYEGTVPHETKMLVSLASSYASGCLYCQSHMANLSSIYKASDEKIAALWNFDESELFTPAERAAVQAHLRRLFGNNRIAVTAPERKGASVELRVGDEFIGTIHRDAEDGEVSYAVQIVVLSEDLEMPN